MEISDDLLGLVLGAAVTTWLWLLSYSLFLACWRPKRAGGYWVMVVNKFGPIFFNIAKWSSLIMLINASLMAVLIVARLALIAMHVAAS